MTPIDRLFETAKTFDGIHYVPIKAVMEYMEELDKERLILLKKLSTK